MTLSELLEELKGIDPETADDIGDIVNVISIKSDGSFSSDAYYPDFIIQGCLQRAIERRVDYRAEKGHETWGMILEMGRDGPEAWIWGSNGVERSGYGDSPAEALLAAYIAAVKGEKK
ncbi:MAG: hypothetical protein WC343_08600 [Bacilli bacterium]